MENDTNKYQDLMDNTIVDQYVFKPQIVKGYSLVDHFNISRRNLKGYCDYLFYEDFYDTIFAYKYNKFYKERFSSLQENINKLYLISKAEQTSNFNIYSETRQAETSAKKILDAIVALREDHKKNEPVYWSEDYFHYWNQRTYRERKKLISKFFSKRKFRDFHYFLSKINEYLRVIADYSFDMCNRECCMGFFHMFGQSFDWLFLLLTETNLRYNDHFLELFQANIVVKNDLIAVTGAINVLLERKALDACYGGELPHAEEYLQLFSNVLESGREVAKLFMEINKNTEILANNEILQDHTYIENIQELESLHQMGVEYSQLHDVDLKPFEKRNNNPD